MGKKEGIVVKGKHNINKLAKIRELLDEYNEISGRLLEIDEKLEEYRDTFNKVYKNICKDFAEMHKGWRIDVYIDANFDIIVQNLAISPILAEEDWKDHQDPKKYKRFIVKTSRDDWTYLNIDNAYYFLDDPVVKISFDPEDTLNQLSEKYGITVRTKKYELLDRNDYLSMTNRVRENG